MEGAPVISSYQERGLLTLFPVHDKEDLEKLDIYWSKNTFSPPLDQIRNYFGESVALYWSFAQTYTRLLIIIATLGLVEFSLEHLGINYVHSNVIFALLNLLSLAAFCEVWVNYNYNYNVFLLLIIQKRLEKCLFWDGFEEICQFSGHFFYLRGSFFSLYADHLSIF